MGRPKGSVKKPVVVSQETVYGNEQAQSEAMPEQTRETAPVSAASHRCFRYHKDLPAGRIFNEGETIPAGWVDTPAKL